MISVKPTYQISPNTNALIPAKRIDCDTIALEVNKRLFVRETPLQLIKIACPRHWSTYKAGKKLSII